MWIPATLLLAAAIATVAAPLDGQQQPLVGLQPELDLTKKPSRGLTGKFLHITDLHLDNFYKAGSSTDEEEICHRGKGNAGYLGAAGTECDSPESLINETFDWIDKHLKNEIDFIIWTGDSARHDNDERMPRTAGQIEELNAAVVSKFERVFRPDKDQDPSRTLLVPVVPNIGNNDIMPHNIFEKGPNRWTEVLAKIWQAFIPEEQRHTFVQGGWFLVEVIPNKLSVFSLNTLYFYDSNNAVDGCKRTSDPGYQQMEWLRVQLELLRERGMKALLMGHVPPARSGDKQAWDESCWQKYTLWLRQYRDVIVGGLYGHMNIDHFMLQDAKDVDIDDFIRDTPSVRFVENSDYENFTVNSKTSYLSSLRDQWADLPSPPASVKDEWAIDTDSVDLLKKKSKKKKKKEFFKKIGGPYAERFSVTLVSPSVVPNYYPTLRVFEYNISGMEHTPTWADVHRLDSKMGGEWNTQDLADREIQLQNSKLHIPDGPKKRATPGPAYSNQALTLLSYAQYYANITRLEKQAAESSSSSPKYHISYEVEYDTRDDDIYGLPDLTVRSYYDLATRIGEGSSSAKSEDTYDSDNGDVDLTKKKKKKKPKENKTWYTFLERAFVGAVDVNQLEVVA